MYSPKLVDVYARGVLAAHLEDAYSRAGFMAPTIGRWLHAVRNGHLRQISREMNGMAAAEWPGVNLWRGRLWKWATWAQVASHQAAVSQGHVRYAV